VVIAAFREPDSEGGQLRYRMLHLNGDREHWKNAQLLYPAGRSDLRPSAAPAVAVAMDLNWFGSMGDKIYCAYVDKSSRLWSVDADQRDAIRKRDWANLPWRGPELISANANGAMGAALFHYVGGLSTGLYCVYVDNSTKDAKSGILRGAVKLFHPAGGLSPWQPLEVNRFTRSAPALAIFQGQLKLAFIDGGTFRPAVLTYVPWTGGLLPQTGVWRQDPSAPNPDGEHCSGPLEYRWGRQADRSRPGSPRRAFVLFGVQQRHGLATGGADADLHQPDRPRARIVGVLIVCVQSARRSSDRVDGGGLERGLSSIRRPLNLQLPLQEQVVTCVEFSRRLV
jgi:hypothetical protein